MSYQSVAWLSFRFHPHTLQFTRYGLVACYLGRIAMLRTYSYECWFHPESHIRGFFGVNTKRWSALVDTNINPGSAFYWFAIACVAEGLHLLPRCQILPCQQTRTSEELAHDEVADRLQHRNSKGGKMNRGISRWTDKSCVTVTVTNGVAAF